MFCLWRFLRGGLGLRLFLLGPIHTFYRGRSRRLSWTAGLVSEELTSSESSGLETKETKKICEFGTLLPFPLILNPQV